MEIQVLTNIIKFLERVKDITGSESYAWVEAHQYVQNKIGQLAKDAIAQEARPGE